MDSVTVTFKLEVSDPDHSTGLTNEDYEMVTDAITQIGGYDVELDLDG